MPKCRDRRKQGLRGVRISRHMPGFRISDFDQSLLTSVATILRHALKKLGTFVLLIGAAASLHAWGPHPEITRAALQSLPPDGALLRHLGTLSDQLTNH